MKLTNLESELGNKKSVELSLKQDMKWDWNDIPDCHLTNLDDNFRIDEILDKNGFVLRVTNYATLQTNLIIISEVKNDERFLKREIQNFLDSKKFIDDSHNEFLIKFEEIFIEKNLTKNGLAKIIKVLENCDYFLHHNNLQQPFQFENKHVISHYNQNELIKILLDLVSLFKLCEESKKVAILANSVICHARGSYKILLQNFIASPSTQHLIFDFENPQKMPRKFSNKLEIQKSSHKTTDTLENEDILKSAHKTEELKLSRSIVPYRFAVATCYELFKQMVINNHNIDPTESEKIKQLVTQNKQTKFKRLFAFFDEINKQETGTLSFDKIDTWIGKMTDHLNVYWNTFYAFKNEGISLLSRPIFQNMRLLRLEITSEVNDLKNTIDIISQQLKTKKKLNTLELCMNGCCVCSRECQKVLEGILEGRNLKRFSWECAQNHLDSGNILCLCEILRLNNLHSINLNFSEFF